MQDLLKLEKQGWEALLSAEDVAKRFYSSLLTNDAVMIFPGGMVLEGKEKILESIGIQLWKFFQIEEPRVISISENAAVIIYKVTAEREGNSRYVALINSTYAFCEGSWKLVIHQQSPV